LASSSPAWSYQNPSFGKLSEIIRLGVRVGFHEPVIGVDEVAGNAQAAIAILGSE
jgi:hypothetical protein